MFVLVAVAPADAKTFANWTQYLFSAGHSSHNGAATVITPANAAKVSLAWKFTPRARPSGLAGFLSSPTVYNGVIYIGARNGNFYALDEDTGNILWSRRIGYVKGTTCGTQGFTATATIAPDPNSGKPTVYVYGASGYVYAMDAANGKDVWPRAKVAVPSTKVNDYYAWGSTLVAHGSIYVGISAQCDRPLVRAGLDSFSQATGQMQGTFWTTAAGTRGGSIWSSPAGNGRSIYFTTGNGPKRSLGFSIIRVSSSLAQQGVWTVPNAQQVPDSDFGGSPTIWTTTIHGRATTMVGACNKNGNYYALRAANMAAGPVWQRKLGNPYPKGPGQCDAAAISDGSHLYLPSNGTTIKGKAYQGSVRKVNPATGAVVWEKGVNGPIIGSPSLDGAGVIAAATFGAANSRNGVWLINANTGKLLKVIAYGQSSTFGQPVFADSYLLVASTKNGLRAYKGPAG